MEKTAVLLVNLGTPSAPEPDAVRPYLAEFLGDWWVIDKPRWQWLPILHGIILRVRPPRVAKIYQKIWLPEGSPLLHYSRLQQAALQQRLEPEGIRVALGMTYGQPSVKSALEELRGWGVRRLLVLPLFPQYSSTTTAAVWSKVQKALDGWRDLPEQIFIRDFPTHPKYLAFLTERISGCIAEKGRPDALVLSYHSIPQAYTASGDDYAAQCESTTDAVRDRFPDLKIVMGYQSKFGNDPWLEPATDEVLRELVRTGHRHVAVMAPGFAADCIETLHELEVEYAEEFVKAGGERYDYLPAANDHPLFIDCLEDLVRRHLPR